MVAGTVSSCQINIVLELDGKTGFTSPEGGS